jgi:hypothetical protein
MKLSTILTDARKGLTAVAGAGGEALALGLLHGAAERWTTFAVGVATAIGVYVVPNKAIDIPGLVAEIKADIAKLQKRPVEVHLITKDPGAHVAIAAVGKAAATTPIPPADPPAPAAPPVPPAS